MKKIKKYKLGSYIQPMGKTGQAFGMGANLLGSAIGGPQGDLISGVASGALAAGPLGALFGGAGAIIGNIGKEKRLRKENALNDKNFTQQYHDNLLSNMDTLNENPYGQVFADGGIIQDPNMLSRLQRNVKIEHRGILRNSDKNPTGKEKLYKYAKNKTEVDPFGEMLDAPQKGLTWLATGKYQKPSEALNIQNKWGAIATDTVLDPTNALFFLNGAKATKAVQSAKEADALMTLPNTINNVTKYTNQAKGTATKIKLAAGSQDVNSVYQGVNEKYAEGGEVFPNIINIEKGELQINPETGKIIREFDGINPETGGLYKPHNKGKDTNNNFVTAEPGTFIITSAKAKLYKDAIDNNDKLLQNTVLQNIRNYKDSKEAKTNKFDLGGFAGNPILPKYAQKIANIGNSFGIPGVNMDALKTNIYNGLNRPGEQGVGDPTKPSGLSKLTDSIGTYGNALYNIGQGIFGKVDTTPQVQATRNPYKSQILNNMPQDISLEPARQQLLRHQGTAFNQIDNTTSGSPIARANKLNVVANTQNQLGMLAMQNQINNNQVRTQRAGMYGNLGAQEMQETNRVQQLNLGINDQNRANKGAKQNMLSTGLTQLQQTYQNNRANNSKASMDQYKIKLLREMFPNLKNYGSLFGEDIFNQLRG